jgi:hypothetical protein
MGSAVGLTMMADSLHSHNSNPRKRLRLTRFHRFYPDGPVIVHLVDGRVKGFASRGG